jgi:hypothetical protein
MQQTRCFASASRMGCGRARQAQYPPHSYPFRRLEPERSLRSNSGAKKLPEVLDLALKYPTADRGIRNLLIKPVVRACYLMQFD